MLIKKSHPVLLPGDRQASILLFVSGNAKIRSFDQLCWSVKEESKAGIHSHVYSLKEFSLSQRATIDR